MVCSGATSRLFRQSEPSVWPVRQDLQRGDLGHGPKTHTEYKVCIGICSDILSCRFKRERDMVWEVMVTRPRTNANARFPKLFWVWILRNRAGQLYVRTHSPLPRRLAQNREDSSSVIETPEHLFFLLQRNGSMWKNIDGCSVYGYCNHLSHFSYFSHFSQ